MSAQNRHPAGSPVGGRYAAGARDAADHSIDLDHAGDGAAVATLRRVAGNAGWPLLADVAVDLNYLGEVNTDALQLIDDDLAVELAEDHIGPAVDSVEAVLESKWIADGAPDPEPVDELAVPPSLDADDLGRRCEFAGVPPHVAGFVAAIADRGNIPDTYLNALLPADLREIDECLNEPLSDLAGRLREIERDGYPTTTAQRAA